MCFFELGKLIISINVIFDEEKFYWKFKEEKSKGKKKVIFSLDLIRGLLGIVEGGVFLLYFEFNESFDFKLD